MKKENRLTVIQVLLILCIVMWAFTTIVPYFTGINATHQQYTNQFLQIEPSNFKNILKMLLNTVLKFSRVAQMILTPTVLIAYVVMSKLKDDKNVA